MVGEEGVAAAIGGDGFGLQEGAHGWGGEVGGVGVPDAAEVGGFVGEFEDADDFWVGGEAADEGVGLGGAEVGGEGEEGGGGKGGGLVDEDDAVAEEVGADVGYGCGGERLGEVEGVDDGAGGAGEGCDGKGIGGLGTSRGGLV